MAKKTKALILSTLVFPGLGQLSLKQYKTALLIIMSALTALIVIIADVMSIATTIANKIIAGDMSSDYAVIKGAILEQQANSGTQLISILTYALIAIWLFSVLHILLFGTKTKTNK